MSVGESNSNSISKSLKSLSQEDIDSLIDNLQPELLEAMIEQNIIVATVTQVRKPLSHAIYNAKKKELIKPLRTQLNFRLPQSLKGKKDDTIVKDILFYKRAYEEEAAQINEIVISTNSLNTQLLEPLITIKENLNKYREEYKTNLNNIGNPYKDKKNGIDNINISNKNEEEKQQFEENKKDVNEEMASYEKQSLDFIKEYSKMNDELSNDINRFIGSFNELKDSVINLKSEMTKGYEVFENSSPEFENLEEKERIKNAMNSIIEPLNKIMTLISENKNKISNYHTKDNKQDTNLAQKMIIICNELKEKAKLITKKINEARLKINLSQIKPVQFDINPPETSKIDENINNIQDKIKDAKKRNEKIEQRVYEKSEDAINKTRLDLLFIIDCTNSINTYLSDIKKNFDKMINDIWDNVPTAKIHIGFIGYTDFSEIEFGEEYININFTEDKTKIVEKIKNLEPHGGGDEAEDLAGAFELSLNKGWKGFTRFAVLATDAPCHGEEFHSSDVIDNYKVKDPKRNCNEIKNMVKKLAENNISLFCAKYGDTTDLMFDIFKEIYDKNKPKLSQCEFSVETCENICETIIQKAINFYKNKKL